MNVDYIQSKLQQSSTHLARAYWFYAILHVLQLYLLILILIDLTLKADLTDKSALMTDMTNLHIYFTICVNFCLILNIKLLTKDCFKLAAVLTDLLPVADFQGGMGDITQGPQKNCQLKLQSKVN
jgi:hypothetical protein